MSAPITEPVTAEPEGNAHDAQFEPYRPAVAIRPQKQPWWQRFFMFVGIASSSILTIGGAVIAGLFWAPAASSYSSYDQPSAYSRMNPEPMPSALSTTCVNGSVRDATGTCVKEADLEAARGKAEKRFSMQMKDGKADFTTWANKQGLKPALKSSREVVLTSYLCSKKPSEDGRLYAANSLGINDSAKYFVTIDDIFVELDRNGPAFVARDICPTVPSWAAPTPSRIAPKPSLPPPPSSAARGSGNEPGDR